jgi:hypothetical protein
MTAMYGTPLAEPTYSVTMEQSEAIEVGHTAYSVVEGMREPCRRERGHGDSVKR